MKTIDLGVVSELKVKAALSFIGKVVLTPEQVRDYDFVFEDNDRFYKIQVKHGKLKNGSIKVDLRRKGPTRPKELYPNSIDYYGIYCSQLDKCYLVPNLDVIKSTIILRVSSVNNNRTNYWAKDFEIKMPRGPDA